MAGGNIFQQGMQSFDQSYDRMTGMRQDGARMRAGRAMASGNRTQAAQEFGAAGMTDDVHNVQRDQAVDDSLQYKKDRDTKDDKVAASERLFTTLKTIGEGLQSIPEGAQKEGLRQRKAMLDHAMPILQQLDPDPDGPNSIARVIGALPPEKLDDQTLQVFLGDVGKHLHGVRLGSDGYGAWDDRGSGSFKTLREPTQKAPAGYRYDADGNLEVDPGYVAGKGAIAKATRAPPRPQARGDGSAPAGTPPWQRTW